MGYYRICFLLCDRFLSVWLLNVAPETMSLAKETHSQWRTPWGTNSTQTWCLLPSSALQHQCSRTENINGTMSCLFGHSSMGIRYHEIQLNWPAGSTAMAFQHRLKPLTALTARAILSLWSEKWPYLAELGGEPEDTLWQRASCQSQAWNTYSTPCWSVS